LKKKLIRTSTVAMSLNILLKDQLAFLNDYYDVVAISGQDIHLENIANRERVKTISVEFKRNISVIHDFISLIKLYKVLKFEKPLIIHSITPKAGLLSMIAAYFAKVPIRIHTFTGLVFPSKTGFLKFLLINLDKILCLFATHIIPEGNGVKNDLLKYKITNKPLKIIANGNVNGINLDYFDPNLYSFQKKVSLKKSLFILDTDFVFIYIGRLVADKGINELIHAFNNLKNKNVKLLLIGDFEEALDPLFSSTLKLINTNNAIISVGFQDDVRPYFSIANALVFPSYREGFPNVVLQASAMNLPCIVTNINGCNEIIQDGLNGIIIEPKCQNEILKAMNLVLDNPEFLAKLTTNARLSIVSRFSQELVWQELLKNYQSIEKKINV
jgi:glycosyltransferase involved in cell wall biosynthesis